MIISRVVGDVTVTLKKILDAINGKLTLAENIQYQQVVIDDSGAANSVVVVPHDLQRIPTAYFWNTDQAGVVYDYQRDAWTSSQITVKCSIAHSVLNLTLL